MEIELALTALHEAAHACVSTSLGQPVLSLTIIPTPTEGVFPGTLGEVCLWPQPRPRARDMFPQSRWVEHAVMVSLAGYVMESAQSGWTAPPVPPGLAASDHKSVVQVMRCVSGHDPEGWLVRAGAIQAKVARFMSVPVVYDRIIRTASLLLERRALTSDEFYDTVLAGKCGMLHPTRPDARCCFERNGHPIHGFWVRDESGRIIDREDLNPLQVALGAKELAKDVSPGLRRLREVNEGGPGYSLSRAWQARAARLASTIPPDIQSLRRLPICSALEDLMGGVRDAPPAD